MGQDTAVRTIGDRRPLAAVAAQFWINGMVYAAVVPRLPELRDRLSMDVSTLGLVLTISALGGLLGSALAGQAIARFGTKGSVILGTVAMVAILPAVGLAPSTVVLTLALAGLAMVDVIVDIGMNIQGSGLSARRATPVMNRLHGLWSLGTVVGGLVAVRAAGAGIPIWAHLTGVSVLLLATLAVSGRFLPQTTDARDAVKSESGRASCDRSAPVSNGRSLAVPGLWLALLAGAAITMEMTTSDWAAFRLADDLEVGPGQAGLGFVAFTAGMVTGRFAGDMVQAALGAQRLVRYASVLSAIGLVIATILPRGFYRPVELLTPTVVTIGGFYVAALGVSVIFPNLYDLAAKAPGPPGRGLATLTAGTRIGALIAPVVVGFVADTSLSVGAAVALVTLPCCAISFLGPQHWPRPRTGHGRGPLTSGP